MNLRTLTKLLLVILVSFITFCIFGFVWIMTWACGFGTKNVYCDLIDYVPNALLFISVTILPYLASLMVIIYGYKVTVKKSEISNVRQKIVIGIVLFGGWLCFTPIVLVLFALFNYVI